MKRNKALACLLVAAAIMVAMTAAYVAPAALGNTSPSASPTGTATTITLHNPWVTKAGTYRGALHAHTTHSDGDLSPEQLTAAYAREGFAFVFITDHDVVTRSAAVGDMLVLPGEEITTCVKCPPQTYADRAGHIVALNLTAPIASQQQPQLVINDVTAQGGMALLAHPTVPLPGMGFTNGTLRNLTGYRFVEVTNFDAPLALAFYDATLTRGTSVWLAGSDDAHTLGSVNASGSVVVNADRLTAADVMANLQAGNFYATTGHGVASPLGAARISSIATSNRTITVEVPEPSTVTWIQKEGAVLKTTDGVTRDTYTVRGDEQYVRVTVTPRAYPAQHAWSQPIIVEARV